MEIAAINLDGDAIQWYDSLESSHGIPIWNEFVEGLLVRFGPTKYENVDGELAKLHQTTTIAEYISRFERLSNRARDWMKQQLVGTFIEALNLEIRHEVKVSRSRTMRAATSLARMH